MKRSVGPPEQIDDPTLRGNRDQLRSLLESTWCEIVGPLHNINITADVSLALEAWEPEQDCYLVRLLLRPTEGLAPLTHKERREMWQRLKLMSESIRSASEIQMLARRALDQAEHAFAIAANDADRTYIDRIREERLKSMSKADADYTSKQQNFRSLMEAMDDAFGSFSCAELVDFISSKKYELKPISIANALAGLPWVGWRHSVRRCSAWKVEDFKGGQYHLVKTICRIINDCDPGRNLTSQAEVWLRSRRANESLAIAELKDRWHYLKRALRENPPLEKPSEEFQYLIAKEYWRRRAKPTAVDRLMEQEERLS
jgi:hypothetical protein